LKRLRIGLDARLVGRGLGIAHYIRELAGALLDTDEIDELVWFGREETAPRNERVAVVSPGSPYPLFDSVVGRRRARAQRLDVMHFAGNTGWRARSGTPFVVTIHDLIFAQPGGLGRGIRQRVGRTYMRYCVPRTGRAASAVITVSDQSAEALRLRGWFRAPTTVIHHGVHLPNPPARTSSDRYFVMFGGRDPRKNTHVGLAAFKRAREQLGGEIRLQVFSGAGMPPALDTHDQPGVEFTGYLEEGELQRRLGSALGLIHPATSEGFGLPVLQAMAAGVPVISGLAPVTREVAGDTALQIDPNDAVGSIAEHVVRLASDDTVRESLARAGRTQASRFSWGACAEAHLAIYRQIARSR
jgi:glycosyltransferase involved in cell wall biosynthesis